MENHTENINIMLNKLRVLESRIKKLNNITDEVLHEVESEYRQKIKDLLRKKEEAQQMLLKIQEPDLKE